MYVFYSVFLNMQDYFLAILLSVKRQTNLCRSHSPPDPPIRATTHCWVPTHSRRIAGFRKHALGRIHLHEREVGEGEEKMTSEECRLDFVCLELHCKLPQGTSLPPPHLL
uniref:Uncharacterized protein n=1 Tax=Sphaerodactylus townsendi TaxID=933632 RepID=A0ACB8G197_9SAUR